MKKIINHFITLFTTALSIVSFTIPSFAEASGWYTKRCGNEPPPLPAEFSYIKDANGIYLDEAATEDDPVIYLTFDAGYINENVVSILDTLKGEKVPGAFFILANTVLRDKDTVLRMRDEGHLVCNHTKNHADLTSLSSSEIRENLTDMEKLYKEKTGSELAKFFRFPEGKCSPEAIRTVNEMGYKTVFWSFGYADWDNGKQPSEEKAIKKILENLHPGEIILLHPTSKTNAKIMPLLIQAIRERGYRFGSLDEIK